MSDGFDGFIDMQDGRGLTLEERLAEHAGLTRRQAVQETALMLLPELVRHASHRELVSIPGVWTVLAGWAFDAAEAYEVEREKRWKAGRE